MDETSPVFENFRRTMSRFNRPIMGTTTRISASKLLGQDEAKPTIEGNARKIKLIKNIIKASRITTGQRLSELSETSPVRSMEMSIEKIKDTMTSILETLN